MTMTADAALLPARASLGATMLYHGLAKVRGEGIARTAGFFEQAGIRPGRPWAIAAGAAEILAGATVLLGIGTRLGAAAVIATQAVAVAKVHGGKGFDNAAGGWEFNALLVMVALGLLLAGPGRISVHEAVERRLERRRGWRALPWRMARARAADRGALRAVKLLR